MKEGNGDKQQLEAVIDLKKSYENEPNLKKGLLCQTQC